jgi:hypothetical protein
VKASRVTITVFALVACRAEPEAERASADQAGAAAAEAKIAVACKGKDDLDPDAREAVETAALEHLRALRGGALEGLWTSLHPQARDEGSKDTFLESLASMQQRLSATKDEAELEQLWVVDVAGGANDLARVSCGGDDATTLQMMANVGDEDLAVASFLSPGEPFTQATTVQLRRRGEAWRLVGIQVNPAKYRGKGAVEFFALGDDYAKKQKAIPAYLMLGVAQTLATRGAALRTPLEERIAQALQVITKDPLFKSETGEWTIGGETFDIQGVSLAATQSDLSPVVKYVGRGGLVRELLGRDADKLMDHVRTEYPTLAEQFDAVVFEAYAEKPTAPGKAYEAYRIARFFDPTRDQPPPPDAPAGAP